MNSIDKILHRSKINLVFIVIIALAGFFRLYGINWDQNQHLHPDERFLTMVTTSTTLPDRLSVYLDPKKSKMNPANVGYSFFVYGTLPLTITKIIAVNTKFCTFFGITIPCLSSGGINNDNYVDLTLIGRLLSAMVEVGSLIFIYLISKLLEKKLKMNTNIKYFAAFFYAIAVLPIQHSHFYIVDTYLVFFIIGALFFSILYYQNSCLIWIIFSAFFFGLALACKITGLYILPVILYFFWVGAKNNKLIKKYKVSNFVHILILLLIFCLTSYLTLRIGDPKFFETKNILDFTVSQTFITNIRNLNQWNNPQAYYPPGVQWIDKKPIIFALTNIAFFSLGLPIFILMIIGLYSIFKRRHIEFIIIASWVLLFFLYQSIQYVKSIRYFYIIYPFFSLLAGYGIVKLVELVGRLKLVNEKNSKLVYLIMIILCLIWPLAFLRIYSRPHSRVMASVWIYQNIKAGSNLSWEYWDDPLPLSFDNYSSSIYNLTQMNIFDPDIDQATKEVNQQKWDLIKSQLKNLDYIILSSNRGYGSIAGPGRKKYPLMSKFYDDLFANKTDFKKIKEITSFPGICIPFINKCVEFDDQWSEETFTVYDHPKVTIFRKIK